MSFSDFDKYSMECFEDGFEPEEAHVSLDLYKQLLLEMHEVYGVGLSTGMTFLKWHGKCGPVKITPKPGLGSGILMMNGGDAYARHREEIDTAFESAILDD